jgi:hypothetical protein
MGTEMSILSLNIQAPKMLVYESPHNSVLEVSTRFWLTVA